MSDVAIRDNSDLARTRNAGRVRITPRVKAAIEHMVDTGADYQNAAAHAGLSTYRMRQALSQPHIAAYLKSQLQVLRSGQSARNIHRLAQIRDAADNMPAVNAIKTLEQIGESDVRSSSAPTPGVTVRIVNVMSPAETQAKTIVQHSGDE